METLALQREKPVFKPANGIQKLIDELVAAIAEAESPSRLIKSATALAADRRRRCRVFPGADEPAAAEIRMGHNGAVLRGRITDAGANGLGIEFFATPAKENLDPGADHFTLRFCLGRRELSAPARLVHCEGDRAGFRFAFLSVKNAVLLARFILEKTVPAGFS